MSRWEEVRFESRIREILATIDPHVPGHHFRKLYLTGYQIAIEFARRYPTDVQRIGLPIGGAGLGSHNSLAQYIAGELSRRIHLRELPRIEGAFLSDKHLADLSFRHAGDRIASSRIGAWDTAIFCRSE